MASTLPVVRAKRLTFKPSFGWYIALMNAAMSVVGDRTGKFEDRVRLIEMAFERHATFMQQDISMHMADERKIMKEESCGVRTDIQE